MRTVFFRIFAILLAIGLCSLAQGFGQEKEEPKKTTTPSVLIPPPPPPPGFSTEKEEPKKTVFQETANDLIFICLYPMLEYWHFPHYASWSRCKVAFGGKLDAGFQERCKRFPVDLIKALGNRESDDQGIAMDFLVGYAWLARYHAARLSDNLLEKDLALAVDCALAPHTGKIKEALVANLQAKGENIRLNAALTLLCLDAGHAKANEVLQASAAWADTKLLEGTCGVLGEAVLTSPQATEYLGRMLKHRDSSVRKAAAGAAIEMGTAARDLVPALITFLETGKNAAGSYSCAFAMARPQSGNLAIMALTGLKKHATPAVPAILARFPKTNDEGQLAMLACLASIGCKDDACLAIVRKSLKSQKPNLRLAAACALLHLAPGEREATDLMKQAFADNETKKLAVEMCQQFRPPSRDIVASLLPMLDDDSEDVRINAMHALGQTGPPAAAAVPGIEKILAKEEDAMKHTFLSTREAAHALSKIRGKEAAAALLRVADSKASGAYYAIRYLPFLGDDFPPTAPAVLVRAIQKNDQLKLVAATALSNLGERARPVRRDLENLLDDPEVGWILDTALRRMPVKSR